MSTALLPPRLMEPQALAAALLTTLRDDVDILVDASAARRLVAAAGDIDVGEVAGVLKAEAERELHVLPLRSAAIAGLLTEIATFSCRDDLAALGAMAAADAFREQGRYTEASQAYDRSGELYSAVHDDVGWARSRIGAAYTRRYTGELNAALAETDRARAILVAHKVPLRLARLESVAGVVLRELGRNTEALAAYDRALAAARELAEPDARDLLEAELRINQATIYIQLDAYERAGALLHAAAATFLRHGRPGAMAQAEADHSRALAAQGRLSEALALVAKVRATVSRLARPADGAMVGQVGVSCLLQLNRPAEAEALADEVVAEFEADGANVELAKTLGQRALARERLGHIAQAAADLERAEALFQQGSCAGWVAVLRLQRAEFLLRSGDPRAALAEAVAAGRDLRRRGQVVTAARADLVRAEALRGLHQLGEAEAAARAARAVGVRHRVPWLKFQAYRLLGELAGDRHDDPQARRAFGRAIAALEEGQGRILTEQRASFLEDKLGVYEEGIRLCMEAGDARGAFRYAERSKARALLDALALKSHDVPLRPASDAAQALADELILLRRRCDRLSAVLFDPRLGVLDDAAERERAPDLRADLARCEARTTVVLEQLRLGGAADVERLALLQGRVYSPLLALDARTALVEYVVAGQAVAVFVLRRGQRIQSVWLPDDGALRRIAHLLRLLDVNLAAVAGGSGAPPLVRSLEVQARAVLGKLHSLLLAPIAHWLAGAERLVIVPHGLLHSVPFAALHDGARYLVESHEVVLAPSASAVTFCRRPLRRGPAPGEPPISLVVANSSGGLLPEALIEADAVAALFPGERLMERSATVDNVRDRARHAQLIHLAAHGLSRQDAPLFSHLRLADGQLTALDCLELDLDCALVTLSACETGRAVLAPGDERIGLTRSLLYAGARSVLQSLWRVEDRATRRLMDEVYSRLRSGAGRGEALCTAQRTMLADEDGKGHRHPFYWASFGLVGEWGPLVGVPTTGRRRRTRRGEAYGR